MRRRCAITPLRHYAITPAPLQRHIIRAATLRHCHYTHATLPAADMLHHTRCANNNNNNNNNNNQ